LNSIPTVYSLPYKWSPDGYQVLSRLIDGLYLATLPLETSVAGLADTLRQGKPLARRMAARRLGAFGPPAVAAVPALIDALADENVLVRRETVAALGKIGPAAQTAIPALTALQHDDAIGPLAQKALKDIAAQ
jgi:adenylate cyclase